MRGVTTVARIAARVVPTAARIALVCFGLASASHAAPPLVPGATTEIRVALPVELRELAGDGKVAPVEQALVAVAVPADFSADRSWPVLVVNATADAGFNSSRSLLERYKDAALGAGWIVIAADPAPAATARDDQLSLRFALDLAALAALRDGWKDAGTPLVAVGGFSGGAKFSAGLAPLFARYGARVVGVYMAGVNEDLLSVSARRFGVLDAALRRLPVFVQSADIDRVATPAQHRAVAASLRDAGFINVRVETVAGRHEVISEPLSAALRWFLSFSDAAASAPR
jgi:hypothetical protein